MAEKLVIGSRRRYVARITARRLRPLLLALAVGCLAALAAVPAQARIAPQQGIAGIKLNMTRAQVVRAKGKPDAERLLPHEILGRQRMLRYGQTRAFFGGFRRNPQVLTVTTRDRDQRTRSGVGVGSTVKEVRDGVAGIKCRREFGFHSCFKGRFRPGQRVTVFEIDDERRVEMVLIGFVID